MTQIKKIVAMSAAAVGVVLCPSVFAQDDLDDLLKELDAEAVVKAPEKGEVKDKEAVAPKAEPAAPEEPAKVEPPKVEPAPEEPAKVEPAPEEPAKAEPAAPEEPAKVEPVPEEPAKAEPAKEPVAEEPKAEEPPAPVAGPDAELIDNIVETERIRRRALDSHALREIKAARDCMSDGKFEDAVRHFGNAEKLLNDRASAKQLREECDMGIASGLYRQALQEWDLGRRSQAIDLMMKARDRRHPKAQRILEKWQSTDTVVGDKTGLADIKHRRNDEDFQKQRELIRSHLRRSRQYLGLRDIEKALEECDIVLVNDPYNEEALRIRAAIGQKRQTIREKERDAARKGMIADVDQAWRPAYTVNAAQLDDKSAETVKTQTGEDPERTAEQEIERRMKEMRLPTISFKPPATIIDAVEFFRQASRDYDRPDIPAEKRGFNFVLRTPPGAVKAQATDDTGDDFTANASADEPAAVNGLDPIMTITASDITFYEALKLVCDSVRYKFIISGQVVMVMPQDMSTAELIARKYNVPESFVERVTSAADELKTMGGTGFGGNNTRKSNNDEEAGEGQDWKAFFEEMGVSWPEGSSIKHIKSLSKLYVRNTRENLAEFEKVLDELGGQPQLIEIETRFVEVAQEDLNSLGFEWLLNSDYNLGVGNKLAQFLHMKDGAFQDTVTGQTVTDPGKTLYTYNADGTVASKTVIPATVSSGTSTMAWKRGGSLGPNFGINASAGLTDLKQVADSDGNRLYNSNGRFLSTSGNAISGEGNSYNDQFMRVNAFLGNADLSMILHMLAQRTDTDLLSAPKVVTKSGENAVIKVVTEYIYPTDYDVQLQSSNSSGGSYGGSSQSAILAIVEPQNFTMREVGVILDVTPTYSEANGGTIDLELKPQVVDEPTWKNYGMKIPFTGNANSSTMSFAFPDPPFEDATVPNDLKQDIITKYWNAVANLFDNIGGGGSNNNITYYDAPMEQPFFHVRSIDSKVSITPGATVVMGGLITEQRKAMDDKIPFLGDLPYIGRLFRSHAEQTIKRNLLIFVTGRLITPSGRELKVNEISSDEGDVKAAPKN